MNCRLCGTALASGVSECQVCGTPARGEAQSARCPVCWSVLARAAGGCPTCGSLVALAPAAAGIPVSAVAVAAAPAPAWQAVPVDVVAREYYGAGELSESHLPRLTRRGAVALGLIVLLIGTLIGGHIALATGVFTPENAALSYVDAEGRNDAARQWDAMAVSVPVGQGQPDASALSEPALAAMSRLPGNRHTQRTNLHATRLSSLSPVSVAVQVQYVEGGARQTQALVVNRSDSSSRFLIYPDWRVLATPGLLDVKAPRGGGPIAVDGVAIRDASRGVYALPGAHEVAMAATPLLAAQRVIVSVPPTGSAPAVAQLEAALNPNAAQAATKAVTDALTACASASAVPAGCPQRAPYYAGTVAWALVGNQVASPSVAVNDDGTVSLSSRYQMKYTPQAGASVGAGASAGPYVATLAWDGTAFTVRDISASYYGATTATRPGAATDELALAAARDALTACAGITQLSSRGCPQSWYSFGTASNVNWQLAGDPTQGATVNFDTSSGTFSVGGTYRMSVTYTDSGGAQSGQSAGYYSLVLLWDDVSNKFVSCGTA